LLDVLRLVTPLIPKAPFCVIFGRLKLAAGKNPAANNQESGVVCYEIKKCPSHFPDA
jgi:hypothetical protein